MIQIMREIMVIIPIRIIEEVIGLVEITRSAILGTNHRNNIRTNSPYRIRKYQSRPTRNVE